MSAYPESASDVRVSFEALRDTVARFVDNEINPHVDDAARTLGQSPGGLIRRVHFPMMKTALMTGLLIVFVDVMKELPATLIMRPFNFDTLAVQAHRLASDERLAQAAVPSLVIMAFGLLPVILLCRSIAQTQQMHVSTRAEMPLAAEA